jgi:2'-5' RNA ligase
MFVAVVPPPPLREHLAQFLEPREGMPWITPEQWHLTLAFLGSVPDAALDDLVGRLGDATRRRRQFELSLRGAGAFPDPSRAKVLWLAAAGASEDLDELVQLALNARSAANAAGATPDGKAFRAHLTLARLKRPIEATKWLRILDTYEGPHWVVNEVELIASYLHEGPKRRPRYETVETFPLHARVELG